MNTDELSIEIKGMSDEASSDVSNLIEKFKLLNNQLDDTFSKLSELTNEFKSLDNVSINKSTPKRSNVNQRELKAPFAEYGSLKSQLESLKLPTDLNSEFYKLKKTISDSVSVTKTYVTANNQVITVTEKVKGHLNGVRVKMKELNTETGKSKGIWSLFTTGITGALTKLKIAWTGLTSLYNNIVKYTKSATEYEESLNLFTVTMGSKAKEATEWVEKFSKALYIDDSGLMQYMGSLNSLIKGLGVGADKSYIMSKNLTQLVYDLASFKNIDIETSFRKIQSAMSGEIEPLRNVGVALSQNTLQELANELGIKQRVATMSEANKAQLRYIQILRSTTEWQGDMGRTLVSPSNALRVLQQQFTLLGRAIGRVFIPFVMKAIPYVMALTEVLTNLANSLARWLGYEITDIDYSSLSDIKAGVEDIGDTADDTTKKLQTMLAPFDELNVVQNKNEGTGTGLSGLGDDLGLDLPEYDALAGLTDKLSKNVEKAKKDLKKILNTVGMIGVAFASWKIANSIMDFLDKWKSAGLEKLEKTIGLTLIIAGVALIAKGELDITEDYWTGLLEKLGGTVAVAGGTYMFTKNVGLTLLVTGISLIAQGLIDKHRLEDNLTGVIEEQLGIASAAAGTYMFTKSLTITLLVTLGFELISIGTSLQQLMDLEPTKKELVDAIGQLFTDVFKTLSSQISKTIDLFTTGPAGLGALVGKNIPKLFNEIKNITITNWNNFWDYMKETITNSWNNFWNYWGGVVKESLTDFIDYWSTTFGKIKDNINEWGENVVDFFKQLPNKISSGISSIPSVISGFFSTAKDKVLEIGANITNGINSIPSQLKEGLSDIPNIFGDAFYRARDKVSEVWTNIKGLFSKGGQIFDGFTNGISDIFKTIINGAIRAINTVIKAPFNGINKILNSIRNVNLPIIGKPFAGLWKQDPIGIPQIPTFAEGGFPKEGEFFMAREAGPEMVGRIGNKTAVANNDQITTSITNALVTALSGMNLGGGQGTTVVNIGGRKVFEGVGDYVDSENDRYGTNYVNV